ncbi:MAG: TetR/AcrR family transcriptional regulator [Phycisphaerae bacterium]|nr:TetR/AcrR family transcriptional regulator [Phycisphaerae bacterium]
MPRPSQQDDKRRELLPVVARAFADLGYRRATTAAIAERCGVQENILYRLWPDKKAMFIAAIGYVYDLSIEIWMRVLAKPATPTGAGRNRRTPTPAERLLAHEAEHLGEFGNHRLIFAGLNETDDPDIRAALADMYRRYHAFVRDHVLEHRGQKTSAKAEAEAAMISWAIIGLGTVANIASELKLLKPAQREDLMLGAGSQLLNG